MAVEGGRATDHILKWAVNLKRTFEEKLRLGKFPGTRILGYDWNEKVKDFVPNPEKAKGIQTLFEEFAEGRLGFEAGGRRLASFGILTSTGKPLPRSYVQKILTNRLYMGVIVWKGETYEGKFTPLVTVELFEKVQKMISKRSRPRKVKRKHNFPFCGIFRCSCGAMITAQWAKGHGGIYRYYRCSRKVHHQPCNEPYIREEQVVSQCMNALRPFALSPQEAAELHDIIEREGKKELQTLVTSLQQIDVKLEPLEEQHRNLRRLALTGTFSDEEYRESKEELVIEQTRLKQEKRRLQKTRENYWIEPARRLVNTLKTLGQADITKNLPEISGIVQKIGTNHVISRKTVSFSFSPKYDFIPSLLASARVASATFVSFGGDRFPQSSKWCAVEGLNL